MSAATLPTPVPPPKPRPSLVESAADFFRTMDAEQTVLLDGVTWEGYDWLDRRRDEALSGVRLFYDDGRLELMTTSFFHDNCSARLKLLVTGLAVGLGVHLRAGGRTTFRREQVARGFEPDESFYIQNAAAIRGVREIDLDVHPPPDLIVEVDHTRSSLPKQPIYAALRVPELWRFDGTTVTFLTLQPDGSYRPQPNSRAFPLATSAEATRLLAVEPDNDAAFMQAVQAWAAALVPSQP